MAALVIIPILMPQKLEAVKRFWVMTPIAAPPVRAWKPQPRPKPRLIEVKRVVPKEIPKPEVVLPKPKIYNPVITTPEIRRRPVRRELPAPEVAKLFHDPNPPISTGSSAIPTLRKPREAVQTGGFGDPDGLPARSKITQTPNVAAVGSFDLPPGPGYGNGTGGAKGARGVIASSGFGNGVAVGSKSGGTRGSVEQAGFANAAAAPTAPRVRQAAAESNNKPVEILFKPRPVYTSEARQKRIEGEVLLQVVFSASGQVEIGKIVRGLGYGLDASAESAAREIRFRPAQRDGQPVDSSAIVHITFQLAY